MSLMFKTPSIGQRRPDLPTTTIRNHDLVRIVGLGIALVASISYSSAVELPPADKGSVSAGGKFTPVPAQGDSKPSAPMSRKDAEAVLRKDFKIEQSAPGKFKIGQVTLDKTSHAIRFGATVNMVDGPVEYAVVHSTGKVHESIFATSAAVRDIHLAMLLLGVKPAEAGPTTGASLKIPDDAAVRVTVEWETNGPLASHPLSSLVALAEGAPDQVTGKTLSDGSWIYIGSGFDAGGFVAMREGSVISLIGDSMALINNPGRDRERDDLHVPNKALLPRAGMPVTIVITRVLPAATP